MDLQLKNITNQDSILKTGTASDSTLAIIKQGDHNQHLQNAERSFTLIQPENTRNINPRPKNLIHNDWGFFLIISGFILLSIIQILYKRRLKMILHGVFGRHYASQLIRERNIYNELISLLLFIIYILSFSLFIYESLNIFADKTGFKPTPVIYIYIAAFLTLFWFVKVFLIWIIGVIFSTQMRSSEYLLNIFLINLLTGLVLLCILLPMIYINGKIFFYIGLIFLSTTFFFKLFKCINIGLSYVKFSRLQLFLYLCTLEILPLVILVKIFYNQLLAL